MKGVRITEFFQDFDKLRKGFVTKDQFRRVLCMQGFTITEDEYKALENKYADKETGHFNYVAFTNNIDKVFTVKGLDKCPTQTIKMPQIDDTMKARRKRLVILIIIHFFSGTRQRIISFVICRPAICEEASPGQALPHASIFPRL